MERLRNEEPRGLPRAGLRTWGMLFVILGIFGRAVLQTRYLGVINLTNDELLQAMSEGHDVMLVVTFALVLQFLETCATPIFALLLADGFSHTSDAVKYMTRVLGVAAVSEIPYNFAMSGKFLDFGSRNPVFGLLFALILLYLYQKFGEKKAINMMYKTVFTVAAIAWCGMLSIEHGIPCVILTATFWALRNKPNMRNLVAGGAAMFCSLFSIFYMVSPMSIMAIHFYNGEQGEENRLVNYLFYPAALIVCAVAGALFF